MARGVFVVIEGLDGSGKSTQAHLLVKYIFENYKKIDNILLTHEPTRSTFGKEIYSRLNAANVSGSLSKERMLELYVLDREQHVDSMIAPLLEKGAVVVCDRYKYSNIAYQGAQGIPVQKIIEENVGFPIPDATIIVNTSVENCIARMEKSGKTMDKFEKTAFLEKVRDHFVRLPTLLPKEKFSSVNGNASLEQVNADIVRVVKPLLDEFIKRNMM